METIGVGRRYRHRRGGTYRVVALARVESDGTPAVVYRAEYEDAAWVRPAAEFADGRFVAIEDDAPVGRPGEGGRACRRGESMQW